MSARVLVVDDDAAVREALAQTLELADLSPLTAGSFVVAKDHITRDFDGVILSDIRMPVMDGIALATATAEHNPGMPILLMTGYAEQRERAEPLMRIVVDVVPKPFSLPDIRQAVADALT